MEEDSQEYTSPLGKRAGEFVGKFKAEGQENKPSLRQTHKVNCQDCETIICGLERESKQNYEDGFKTGTEQTFDIQVRRLEKRNAEQSKFAETQETIILDTFKKLKAVEDRNAELAAALEDEKESLDEATRAAIEYRQQLSRLQAEVDSYRNYARHTYHCGALQDHDCDCGYENLEKGKRP